ncbi:MAG: helix-turn-helix domain-containing protein, partial [Pseudonocardiaceae bacterium]
MSYGHAGNLAGEPSKPPGQLPGQPPPGRLDPALLDHPDVRAAAAAHQIGDLYRTLKRVGGVTQRTIGKLTGQSQSEVSDILSGRDVGRYEVLVRICVGLGIPREWMGVSWYGPDGAYAGDVTVAEPPKGVDSAMRRRGLLLSGAAAAFGAPVLGALLGELPGPASAAELPNRLDWHHVAKVRDTTHRLGWAAHGCPADPDVCA